MSTLFVAGILLCFLAVFIVLFTANENRKKQAQLKRFSSLFSELGLLNNLTFSSQEILKDAAIGLDGRHRKLLVLNRDSAASFRNQLVHLAEVKTCAVKKHYAGSAAALKKSSEDRYLEKVALQFAFKNNREPVEVIFYHHINCGVYEINEMNEKARHWEVILSKMLGSSNDEMWIQRAESSATSL
jgi:hypothetical protein